MDDQTPRQQEPVWEYRWAFVMDGLWGGRKETNFWMVDWEAERWVYYGKLGTERLDETRRDRNIVEAETRRNAPSTGGSNPWAHPYYTSLRANERK